MRRLVAREKGEDDVWDLKLVAGGLLDIEFIAQTLALEHGGVDRALLAVETAAILRAAQNGGALDPDSAATLLGAHRLYSTVLQMARLTTGLRFRPREAAAGVLRRIAAAVEAPDFSVAEAELGEARRGVREIFARFFKP
jgi:glutamate-ammonia-ligase adenylyltransferase